jgi:hypothetical protein
MAHDRIEYVYLVKQSKAGCDRSKMLREYARSLCETANESKQAIEFTTKTYLETLATRKKDYSLSQSFRFGWRSAKSLIRNASTG